MENAEKQLDRTNETAKASGEYLYPVFDVATDLCDMFGQNATYNPNGYLRKT